ncbi:unnamed protein product [Blepharisma stoltei]|uniref:Uncharacterized protein n=1 Tax=Blepharisma stoltei TaxID=1481888 RepID=A0AAU9JHJ5_9CILI|nr:unnamed protein product [Blepharisma stoltei]
MQNQFSEYQSSNNESLAEFSASPTSPRSQQNFSGDPLDSSESEENSSDNNSSDKEDIMSLEEISSKHMALRASTAPARPLSDIEEFRRTSDFLLLEHTVICASQLIQNQDQKYDLDSEEGQRACKKFLNQIERLCEVFKVNCVSRDYRKAFSKAYQVLYKEGTLCFLTEILDSAQEGFPYLYVNGEKYLFSSEVLDAGSKLFHSFCKIQHIFREIYNRICEETSTGVVGEIISDLTEALQDFDTNWVDFEHLYVHELMVIETDARRFITQAIELEREMSLIEVKEKARGRVTLDSEEFNSLRDKFVVIIGKINSVANVEGKGRDDLSLNILLAAEGISRRMHPMQSHPIRKLADKIRQAFTAFRTLFRKYDQNIEVVDPQLKNNPELVEALTNFEGSWERGKEYILNSKRCNQVVHIYNLIEKNAEKYPTLKEQLEFSDSQLFVSVPSLLVLKCLEDDDKGICKHFCPQIYEEHEEIGIVFKRLKRSYKLGKLASSSVQEYAELLEMMIIGEKVNQKSRTQIINPKFDNLDHVLTKITNLSIAIQRQKPSEWNRFLDVVLC